MYHTEIQTFKIDGDEFEVEFEVVPEDRTVGMPMEIDICRVLWRGRNITQILSNRIFDKIEDKIIEGDQLK